MNQENYYHKLSKTGLRQSTPSLALFGPLGSKLRAFTIVELLIAAGLLSVFLVGIGLFFLQGNKAAAKGTWRVHTVEKMRLGMSLLRRALDGTSYPSFTSNNDFSELGPEHPLAENHDLNFNKMFSKDSTTPVTFFAGTDDGLIVQFTTATPYQIDEVGNSVPGSGLATAYTITLNSDFKTVIDGNRGISHDLTELIIEGKEQIYTYATGPPPTLGTFTDQGGLTRIRIPDVHQVSFRVAKSYPNPEYEGTKSLDYPRITLEIYIECRDPFDGRLAVTQTLVYMINTQVRSST